MRYMPPRNASTTSPCISTLPSLSATRLQWLGRARPRVGGRARGSASAGEDDVGRLRAFLTLLGYELDLRALGEGLEALARDAAEMDEEVFAAVVRGDEPIPLGVIEPLHGSGCHLSKTPPCLDSRTGRKVQEQARPDHALIERWESSSILSARRDSAEAEPRRGGYCSGGLGEVAAAPEGPRVVVERVLQARERRLLELAHPLAGELEHAADLLERQALLAVEAEPELEYAPLALGQAREGGADALALERLVGLLDRVGGGAVGEQVAELAVTVRADGLVQRNRRLDGVERLLHMVQLEARRLRELLDRRLPAEADLEALAGAIQLLLSLLHVHRHADRRGLVGDRALAGLADPPGRVRRELEPLAVVELLDRAVQADDAVLDQVEERHPVAAVALRDRHDEPQVRVDHPLLGREVAPLDALCERDLVGGRQQLVAADLGQEHAERVGRDRTAPGREIELEVLLFLGCRQLNATLGQERLERRDGVLVELVLEHKGVELGRFDLAALLRLRGERVQCRNFDDAGLQVSSFLLSCARRRAARAVCECSVR